MFNVVINVIVVLRWAGTLITPNGDTGPIHTLEPARWVGTRITFIGDSGPIHVGRSTVHLIGWLRLHPHHLATSITCVNMQTGTAWAGTRATI